MLTLISGNESEVLDAEAVAILNTVHFMNQEAPFWVHFQRGDANNSLTLTFIHHIRRGRAKEPDFAEGENESNDVCSPPTRAGS